MFFWFIATAVFAVGYIFRDPRFDYRLLIVGSVLPLLDGVFGGARALHSITVSIGLLVVLMLATSGRKPIRKMLLGLPIGMFMHLVFDGAWNDTDTFWWPFTGVEFGDAEFPVAARGIWSVLLETLGMAGCVWLLRRNRLGDAERRRGFMSNGQLSAVSERFG